MAKDDDTPRCSFCHKGQADVAKLIANPTATAWICDECIKTSHFILEQQRAVLPLVSHPANRKDSPK